MTSVELKSIEKRYAQNQVVKPLDVRIEDKDFFILLGPSGCGKTTLLRIIAGLEEPSSGKIFLGDRDVTEEAPKHRDMAMVFQSYALYPHMKVKDNMGFGLKMRGVKKSEIESRVMKAARILELEELLNRRPRALSGGQRQRVALGRALVREPKVFLMDEPLSNLDAKLRSSMRHELMKIHQELQATIVYVTHDQVEAMTMGTRIMVLNEGRIHQVGSPEDLYQYPKTEFVASFIGSPPMNILKGRCEEMGGTLHFTANAMELKIPGSLDQNGEYSLGIRPENLFFDKGAREYSMTFEAHHSENLGAESLVYGRVGQQDFIVRSDHPPKFRTGEKLQIYFDHSNIRWFNKNGDSVSQGN